MMRRKDSNKQEFRVPIHKGYLSDRNFRDLADACNFAFLANKSLPPLPRPQSIKIEMIFRIRYLAGTWFLPWVLRGQVPEVRLEMPELLLPQYMQ